MSRLQNISKKLIPLILLIAVAIGSFCVYFNQHYLTAKNPLTQAVAEHYEEQNNTNRIKKPKYKIIKEIATKQEKINQIELLEEHKKYKGLFKYYLEEQKTTLV